MAAVGQLVISALDLGSSSNSV